MVKNDLCDIHHGIILQFLFPHWADQNAVAVPMSDNMLYRSNNQIILIDIIVSRYLFTVRVWVSEALPG